MHQTQEEGLPIIQSKRRIELQNGPHAGETHEFAEPVSEYVSVELEEWNDPRGVWSALYRVSPLGGRAQFEDVVFADVEALAEIAAETGVITEAFGEQLHKGLAEMRSAAEEKTK